MNGEYLNAELFRVDDSQLASAFDRLKGYPCFFNFPDSALKLFPDERDRLFHAARLLSLRRIPAIVLGDEVEPELVALEDPTRETLYAFGYKSEATRIYLEASDTFTFRNPITSDFPITRKLLTDSLRSKISSPLRVEGNTVYDTSTNLAPKDSEKTPTPMQLKPLRVHSGFSFQFRTFGKKLYLQVSPKSTMDYSKSIHDLLQEGWTNDQVLGLFLYSKIRDFGSQRLLEISGLRVSDKIQEPPFFGRSFQEYSTAMYPKDQVGENDAFLVRTASYYGETNYFPSTWAFPSPNFRSLSLVGPDYYSELTGVLKTQGRSRIRQAWEAVAKLSPLEIAKQAVTVAAIPERLYYDPNPMKPHKIREIKELGGYILSPPSLSMLRNGKAVEIIPGVDNYQGTINDLLANPELKPLDAPDQIRVIAFVHAPLKADWALFKTCLTTETKFFRGFESIFGVKLDIEEHYVKDFLGPDSEFSEKVKSLEQQGFDVALTVIPRTLDSEESREIYENSKTQIMEKGIPVQVVVDDTRTTSRKDDTLKGKAKRPRALFGLSLNILAKAGAILTAISETVADALVTNSMTIGYNPIQIVPKKPKGIRSIPVAAPLVIFDNRGAYVSHQDIYKLKNEVSLFQEHGEEIFRQIPREVSHLIIHKDGPFNRTELEAIDSLSRSRGIEAIPISIRTGFVPRVSNPKFLSSGVGFKAGTTLQLSRIDYLMVTTPFSGWDPEELGWPNPILVTIHKADAYDTTKIIQLLYHVFGLTKMQTGSQRATRTPVSIHFANMIGRFLRRVGEPNPAYLKFFVKPRKGGKYLPRWFI
jgi:hypothetical protein